MAVFDWTCPALPVPAFSGEQAVLVRAIDAVRLCREEGYRRLPHHRTLSLLGSIERRNHGEMRSFLAQVSRGQPGLTSIEDVRVVPLLRDLVRSRDIVAVCEGDAGQGAASDATLEQRRLVRAIEALTRGKRLGYQGREYRIVADADMGRLPDRDSYEVVRRADADQVLAGLAKQNAAPSAKLADLLVQARRRLTQDWRPPMTADGLILFRRIPQVAASGPSSAPVMTPSQMKKLVSDWIEIEVLDEDGVPYTGSYSLDLPDSTSTDGTFDDKGSYGNYAIDTGKCKLFLPGKPEDADEFSVTVVDETGQPIANVPLVFGVGESNLPVTSDGSGVAKRKVPKASSVSVTFADASALATTMKTVWAASRKVERKDWVAEDETTATVSLFGGRVVEAISEDTAEGALPEVDVERFEGLDVSAASPGTISVQPLVLMASLLGEHFDTNKCFLLPKALDTVQDLVRLHQQYQSTDMLIVGHTDTSGDESYNLDLSLERASAMRAYLTNDADAWLDWYGTGKPAKKRWGETEDALMIGAVLDASPYPATVLGYQQWHNASATKQDGYENLDEDGAIGPHTRKQLILDYMHREDTTVPDGTTIEVHGCGEFFPLDDAESASDDTTENEPADGQDQPEDRRVEVFLFPKEIGIAPPVPGDKASQGEKEYPEWRRRAVKADLASDVQAGECVVSVILMSNSGNVVLSNRKYELRIENGPVLEGKTDADGFLEHKNLPAGDHTLVVDGCESRVGATPADCTRRQHMMAGYVLIDGDDI
jgi:outer membrane protein OmpA-like peptidoglycan-associated protein